jgi:hypothetical protein
VTSKYTVQYWADGHWRHGNVFDFAGRACQHMIGLDVDDATPRRVVDNVGTVLAAGRHCARDTPVNDVKTFSIVMSLDKPGPCERDGKPYRQHASRADAISEARRLSQSARGGRFGVLELVHVVGWIDVDLEAEIPF